MSQEEFKQRLRALMKKPENQVCSDCSDIRPSWASLIVPPPGSPEGTQPIGAFCCLQCSGSHRRIGVHICFVRSIQLDTWKEKEVLALENGGNKKVNIIYEGNDHFYDDMKPDKLADLPTRESFVRAKYERREYFLPEAFQAYVEGKEYVPVVSDRPRQRPPSAITNDVIGPKIDIKDKQKQTNKSSLFFNKQKLAKDGESSQTTDNPDMNIMNMFSKGLKSAMNKNSSKDKDDYQKKDQSTTSRLLNNAEQFLFRKKFKQLDSVRGFDDITNESAPIGMPSDSNTGSNNSRGRAEERRRPLTRSLSSDGMKATRGGVRSKSTERDHTRSAHTRMSLRVLPTEGPLGMPQSTNKSKPLLAHQRVQSCDNIREMGINKKSLIKNSDVGSEPVAETSRKQTLGTSDSSEDLVFEKSGKQSSCNSDTSGELVVEKTRKPPSKTSSDSSNTSHKMSSASGSRAQTTKPKGNRRTADSPPAPPDALSAPPTRARLQRGRSDENDALEPVVPNKAPNRAQKCRNEEGTDSAPSRKPQKKSRRGDQKNSNPASSSPTTSAAPAPVPSRARMQKSRSDDGENMMKGGRGGRRTKPIARSRSVPDEAANNAPTRIKTIATPVQ